MPDVTSLPDRAGCHNIFCKYLASSIRDDADRPEWKNQQKKIGVPKNPTFTEGRKSTNAKCPRYFIIPKHRPAQNPFIRITPNFRHTTLHAEYPKNCKNTKSHN